MAKGETKDPESMSNTTPAPEMDGESIDVERSETPTDINIVLRCTLKNDVERFVTCFDDENDPFHERINDMLNERNEEGKTAVEMAAILGRIDMLKELITRGAELLAVSGKGYTPLHYAAAWGQADCLKLLVDNGANIQQKTTNDERAREIACRYSKSECVDYLDWAESKQEFQHCVTSLQDTLADPEKVQGRLTRDEKNSTLALIKEKLEWVEATVDATTQDFMSQKQTFEEATAAVIQKLSEPLPEKPEKK